MARIHYKRSRFATKLDDGRLYTAGHYWLEREEAGAWRVGFTKFATRMLGDVVELELETRTGAAVQTGQIIGWLEGFKAVADIFAPLPGTFLGANPALEQDIELITREPYDRGWVFRVQGEPGAELLDVSGYSALLDTTIDKMLGRRHD